nr:ABC transporter permease [Actinomycetota bacterium]
MGALSWVGALARHRPSRVVGPALGVALAVALLGSLGTFVASAKGQMTRRAIAQVPVDWQVQVQPGGDATAVASAIAARRGVVDVAPVAFGQSSGLSATTGETIQTTGPGVVVGLPEDYRARFPREIRTLAGAESGVLLAQQTAANLHAGPGDVISIAIAGASPVTVAVAGVVELPFADSLFQKVGAPTGSQPSAPPDNVVLVPIAAWHGAFDPIVQARPDLIHGQVHLRLDHHLPADPSAAYTRVTAAAHRLEADLSGSVLVGDNLGATLDAARKDALYAEVLFVLLATPGAGLAALLTRAVASTDRDRRRRELALLRLRGASLRQLNRFPLAEAAVAGTLGATLGLGGGLAVGHLAFASSTFGATATQSLLWAGASGLAAVAIALVAVVVPARRDATLVSVVAARRVVGRAGRPLVLRYGTDFVLLALAGIVFWATSRSHYSLVLAPEGVSNISVSYWVLSGPFLLWLGGALLSWRLADLFLGHQGPALRRAFRLVAGRLAGPVAATTRRQRRSLAASIVLVAMALAFAISTSVFNATYRQQVGVDALLTNGAPVTVVEPPAAKVPVGEVARLERVPGAGHVEPLVHRFVYVGNDLQDLYGVNPATIANAGKLQDAYFGGGTADEMLTRLKRQPNAVLVSDETMKDFQLHVGDPLHLRVRDAATGNLVEVTFDFVGVIKEFPTAPRDSFIVANASYIAQQTGDPSPGTFLVATNGSSPHTLAERVRHAVGTGATVTDIETSRRVVGSSLTAVDLAGLTRVELAYAVVLAIAATGLVLGLGISQRRRSFAIITALGAKPKQLAV